MSAWDVSVSLWLTLLTGKDYLNGLFFMLLITKETVKYPLFRSVWEPVCVCVFVCVCVC